MQQKRETACLFLFILMACTSVMGKPACDSMTVDEMKQGFLEAFARGTRPDMLSFDRLLEEGKMRPEGLIATSSALKKTEAGLLPPSTYLLVEERKGSADSLYWVGTNHAPQEGSWLRDRLTRKYGETSLVRKHLYWNDSNPKGITLADTLKVVPAKWVTGTVAFLRRPRAYGKEIVSRQPEWHAFKDGASTPADDFSQESHEALTERESWLASAYDAIAYPQLTGREENTKKDAVGTMRLLAHDVNMRIPIDKKGTSPSKTYALLLWFDGQRKCHVEPLWPQQENEAKDAPLMELGKVVETLPPGLFPSYYTAHGKLFPGRYLLASYTKSGGWLFDDFFYLDRAVEYGASGTK